MKIRKNITISDTMLDRGDEVAKARGFDDFSEMISALIREEYERRGLAEFPALKDAPNSVDPLVAKAEAETVAIVETHYGKGKKKPAKKPSK